MEFPHVPEGEEGGFLSVDRIVAGSELSHFGESIHYSQYAVVSFTIWKAFHEVHEYFLQWSLGDWEGADHSLCSVGLGLARRQVRQLLENGAIYSLMLGQ